MIKHALRYAELGWAVFPCIAGRKEPAVAGGFKACSKFQTSIECWWTASKNDNIGIATGAVSGIVVVDIDVKNGVNGMEAWAKVVGGLKDKGLKDESRKCPAVRTPSGGWHIYFRHPGKGIVVKNRANLYPGIDVRGDGGYVLAPPSRLENGIYLWERPPYDLSSIPYWTDDILPPSEPVRVPALRTPTTNQHNLAAYAQRALDEECRRVANAAPGERNEILNRAAFNLGQIVASGELTQKEVRSSLIFAADGCGLIEDDGIGSVRKTLHSGLEAGMNSARAGRRATKAHSMPASSFFPQPPSPPENRQPATPSADHPNLWHFGDLEPKPTNWVISELVPEDSCVVIGAEMKTGKTWLAMAMSIAVANAIGVLGFRAPTPGDVLMISPEGSKNGIARRLWGLCWGMGVNPVATSKRIHIWPGAVTISNPEHYHQLTCAVQAIKPRMLVLDPLVTALAGVDENDASSMSEALNKLRDICTKVPGMALVVAHHLNKAHKDHSILHALRGSTALPAWLDGFVGLQLDEETEPPVRTMRVIHRDDPAPPKSYWTVSFDRMRGNGGVPAITLSKSGEGA